MSRNELLKLCHFYAGEADCPQDYDQTPLGQLWQAEKMLCENILCDNPNIQITNPRRDFDRYVAAYVSKWNPWRYHEVLDIYFEIVPDYRDEIMASYN